MTYSGSRYTAGARRGILFPLLDQSNNPTEKSSKKTLRGHVQVMVQRAGALRRLVVMIAFSAAAIAAVPCPIHARDTPRYSTSRGSAPRESSFLVTRFGAKCDGVNDDTSAFEAALDAAGARCQARGAYVITGYS